MGFKNLLRKWIWSSKDRMGLDFLLGQAPAPTSPLRERLRWLSRLVNWARREGSVSRESQATLPAGSPAPAPKTNLPAVRMKYILQILERNVEMKDRVCETLRSIIHDTTALDLFLHMGIPNQEGFLGELVERCQMNFLPQPPRDNDLIYVFSETFKYYDDVDWIKNLDPALFNEWINLFQFSKGTIDSGWNTLVHDARDALHLLAYQVRAVGLSNLIRHRMPITHFSELPFFNLTEKVDLLLAASEENERFRALEDLKKSLAQCFKVIHLVHEHIRVQGASLFLIYQLVRLRILLLRIQTLAFLIADYKNNPVIIQKFMSSLIYENIRARGFKGLFEDNMSIISQKIIETNAETGEHYITRDRKEYWVILKKAFGGGFLTGFTILIKFMVLQKKMAPFVSGLFQSLNYAISFLLLQWTGFTLATKQPAMTATVIAQKIPDAEGSVGPLLDEITHLIRSQLACVTGNLVGVIPTVLLIDFIFSLFHSRITSTEYAQHTIDSFSILGMTPFYAAVTGVLLWMSSVFAGWFYNWFCYRGLPEAIEFHPRLIYVFGAHRAKRFADFLKRNMAGAASSISLGFLLGMTPQIGIFFGIPLDVRHVTLSTGSMAASAWVIGPSIVHEWSFWLGLVGLLSMAILNLAVSFGLALGVAIWAKREARPSRAVIYGALLKRFLTQPLTFFLPTGQLVKNETDLLG